MRINKDDNSPLLHFKGTYAFSYLECHSILLLLCAIKYALSRSVIVDSVRPTSLKAFWKVDQILGETSLACFNDVYAHLSYDSSCLRIRYLSKHFSNFRPRSERQHRNTHFLHRSTTHRERHLLATYKSMHMLVSSHKKTQFSCVVFHKHIPLIVNSYIPIPTQTAPEYAVDER